MTLREHTTQTQRDEMPETHGYNLLPTYTVFVRGLTDVSRLRENLSIDAEECYPKMRAHERRRIVGQSIDEHMVRRDIYRETGPVLDRLHRRKW